MQMPPQQKGVTERFDGDEDDMNHIRWPTQMSIQLCTYGRFVGLSSLSLSLSAAIIKTLNEGIYVERWINNQWLYSTFTHVHTLKLEASGRGEGFSVLLKDAAF